MQESLKRKECVERVLTGGLAVDVLPQDAVTAAKGSAWATAASLGDEISKVTI